MASSADTAPTAPSSPDRSAEEELTKRATVPRDGLPARIRANRGIAPFYRAGVFVVGLALILLGFALAVLPGPLTIPPVLLGLWIWSTEFRFARRLFESFAERARDTWAHAKRHPVSSGIVTVGGLIGAGLAAWAVARYELVARALELVGI